MKDVRRKLAIVATLWLYQTFSPSGAGLCQEPPLADWSSRVETAMDQGRHDEALRILNGIIAQAPSQASLYIIRGMNLFRMGKVAESLADFDRSIELSPETKPECWQRGISLYYLGRYQEGVDQFEVHRTVNPNDVENAFWHFLCLAKLKGVDAARKSILECGRDSRPPLMEVLEMLHGKMSPEEVVAAAENARGGPVGKSVAKFYGYLYVGLYCHANGQADLSKQFLDKCIAEKVGGYMRDVAVIHRSLFP